MSQFFESRCNGRQNGGRESRVEKDIPDGISRGPEEAEALANQRTRKRREERRKQQQRRVDARTTRRAWAEQVS